MWKIPLFFLKQLLTIAQPKKKKIASISPEKTFPKSVVEHKSVLLSLKK